MLQLRSSERSFLLAKQLYAIIIKLDMASVNPITRVTLFKIPDQADQEKLLDIYKEMPNKAKKV